MSELSRQLVVWAALAAVSASGCACQDARAQRPVPQRAPEPTPTPDGPPRAAAPSGASLIAASPVVSRDRPVVGASAVRYANPKSATDGDHETAWNAGKPTAGEPAWIAIDVGHGPTRLLLQWTALGSFNYNETDYGSPGAYRIETSPDSTDGVDGSWRSAVEEKAVTTHSQAHSFDARGQRWVKLVVTGAPDKSPNGVQIDEIEVHDVSAGVSDAWFFMGDSITAFAFGRLPKGEPGFAARVSGRHPGHAPVVIGGGIGGEKSDEGVGHIDEWLRRNPDARFWAIGYGTNDSAGDSTDTSRFRTNLQTIIDRVRQAGRVPILATIPFASDGQHAHIDRFNAVIEELRSASSLPRGPDLHAWFLAHPGELKDGLHPDDRGIASINRLWAEAVDVLYAP